MAKIKKVRQHGFQPKAKLPAIVQMRKTAEFLEETERQAAKMRRLLWLVIKQRGGRIEFTGEEYKEAMEGAGEDRIVAIEQDGVNFVLVFQDKDGKRLSASESGIIITG